MIVAVQCADADRGHADEHAGLLLIAANLRAGPGIENRDVICGVIADDGQQSIAEGHRTTGAIAKFEGFEPGREH